MGTIYAQGSGVTNGTDARDTIYGNDLDNALYGNGGNDRIFGGAGDDFISGSRGRDTLNGGAGSDGFYFGASALSKSSYDVITDFDKKNDAIALDPLVFSGLGRSESWMKRSAFWQGTKAHDGDDRIIYNPKNGIIYYDADGTGSTKAIPIVKVGAGKKLAASDFWVEHF